MNVLLIVSGSIAAERSKLLIERLERENNVKVIVTRGGEQFFKSQHQNDQIDPLQTEVLHIEYAKWADKVLVAPASYNFINCYANGMANRLSLLVLSAVDPKKVVLAPAMNHRMWDNKLLISNVQNLKNHGVKVINPVEGELSCGEINIGHLAPINTIMSILQKS